MYQGQQRMHGNDRKTKPQQSVEGWIIIVTNIEKDMLEDDLFDSFSDFGEIKSINLNPDRRTGQAKGYSLIQYAKYQEAEEAIKKMNGSKLGDRPLRVDWAFKTGPIDDAKR